MESWPPDDLLDYLDDVVRILDMHYGPRQLDPGGDVARALVRAILSQSTNGQNSGAAMASLEEAFTSWDEVIAAPTGEVARAIRIGGLSNQKAPRIQSVLRGLRDQHMDSGTLAKMPVREAMDWLTSLEGVGPTTAALVLLFALGRPVMPVESHIARVMTRLGIVPDHTSTVTKQRLLTNLLGPNAATIHAVHVETIEHGRTLCRARKPLCGACPLQDVCAWYRQVLPA